MEEKMEQNEHKGQIEFKIYFGKSMMVSLAGGGKIVPIKQKEIDRYLDKISGTCLSSGFTILEGQGFWGQDREKSFVLVYVGPDSDREKVKAAAGIYKRSFAQEAVIITETQIMMEVI